MGFPTPAKPTRCYLAIERKLLESYEICAEMEKFHLKLCLLPQKRETPFNRPPPSQIINAKLISKPKGAQNYSFQCLSGAILGFKLRRRGYKIPMAIVSVRQVPSRAAKFLQYRRKKYYCQDFRYYSLRVFFSNAAM